MIACKTGGWSVSAMVLCEHCGLGEVGDTNTAVRRLSVVRRSSRSES